MPYPKWDDYIRNYPKWDEYIRRAGDQSYPKWDQYIKSAELNPTISASRVEDQAQIDLAKDGLKEATGYK